MRGRNRKGPNPLTRSYESNGGDVKIRGTAIHVAEKYQQLARDAQASGDRVGGENYLQHAEHYFRIVAAAQQQQQQQAAARAEAAGGEFSGEARANGGDHQSAQPAHRPTVGPDDPQPFANANGAGERKAEEDAGVAKSAPTSESAAVAEPVQTEAGETNVGDTRAGETAAAETTADEPGNRRGRTARNPRGPRRRPPYRDRSPRSETATPDQPPPQADEQS